MKHIYKCRWDKKIAGVCGGLGQYLNIDPTIIRLLCIFLGLLTAVLPILIAYLVAYLIMPTGPKVYIEPKYKRLYRSTSNRKIAGICGGFAKYFKVDSTIVRIIAIVGIFLVPLPITYLIGIFVVPEEPRAKRH